MTESDADFVRTKPGYGRIDDQFGGMQSDVIESMATIGAGRVWRRTGRVVYATGWEMSDVDWWGDGPGDDGIEARTELYAHRGAACLELSPSTEFNPSWARVSRRAPYIPATRTGMEMSVWMKPDSAAFVTATAFHVRTERYRAQVEIDPVNQDINILASVGGVPTEVKVDDLLFDWRDANMQFHNIKLVINFSTKRYEGLYIDNKKWDLSEHLLALDAVGVTYYIELQLLAHGPNDPRSYVYVDDFIQTIDEPEGLFK